MQAAGGEEISERARQEDARVVSIPEASAAGRAIFGAVFAEPLDR